MSLSTTYYAHIIVNNVPYDKLLQHKQFYYTIEQWAVHLLWLWLLGLKFASTFLAIHLLLGIFGLLFF